MHPELFTFDIPLGRITLPVRSYGVMLLLGVLAAFLLARPLARKSGIGIAHVENLVLINVLFGILGARIFFFLFYSKPESVWDLFKVWEGGLVFYGGVFLAAVASVLYIRVKRLPLGEMADIIAPCLALGVAFGRVGCFLNGCCWGDVCMDHSVLQQRLLARTAAAHSENSETISGHQKSAHRGCAMCSFGGAGWVQPEDVTNPWAMLYQLQSIPEISGPSMPFAVRFPVDSFAAAQHREMGLVGEQASASLPVHPVQLYEAALSASLALTLVISMKRRHLPGEVFTAFVIAYGAVRFWTEILRADNSLKYWGMSVSQVLSLCCSIGFVALFTRRRLVGARPQTSPK